MKNNDFNPDDPRLTAYALGEMEATERAEFEQWLAQNPAALRAVDEIRATADLLGTALAEEPEPAAVAATPPVAAAAIIPRTGGRGTPGQLDGGPAPETDAYRRQGRKLLRFPALYYVTAGLAAACFALVLFNSGEYPGLEDRKLIEMDEAMVGRMRAMQANKSNEAAATPATGQAVMTLEAARAEVAVTEMSTAEIAAPTVVAVPPVEFRGLTAQTASASVESSQPGRALTFGGAPTSGVVGGARVAAAPTAKPMKYASADTDAGRVTLSAFAVAAKSAPEAGNTEGYAQWDENPFLTVAQNPLSTFSIDVDTAAYANVRRFLTRKQRPPKGAVRIEELVNYFPYRYAPPAGPAPFAAHLEVAGAPWAPEHRLVRIGLKGREVSDAARPPANLVFLLDVSGSMSGANKLPLLKQSMQLLVGRLRPDDRVAIVVYAGASGVALPPTPVREQARIRAAIESLRAEGSTNGAAGIRLAYDLAREHFITGGVNRVLLATDGDFNVGVSSESELMELIRAQAKSGVFLSVLGFGMGNYKDSTLEKLADQGNGNYAYIDSLAEARKTLVAQAGGTLVTIAKDVKLQVEFNPAQVQAYRLIGYENRMLRKEDFNDDKVDAGEIGAGHTVTALYEIVPVGAEVPETGTVDPLKYQKVGGATARAAASGELLTLKVRYKDPAGDESAKLEFPLRDAGRSFAEASADFKFAAAVAAFGLRLRESPHRGEATFAQVGEWARAGIEDDPGGHRAEFLELVDAAARLVEE